MFHLLRNINDKNIFKNNKVNKLCVKFESARNLRKNTTAAIAVQQLRRFRFWGSACCPARIGARTRDVARANVRLHEWPAGFSSPNQAPGWLPHSGGCTGLVGMFVVILGCVGAGEPVHEVSETGKKVEHYNSEKYGSHIQVILMGAKLAHGRHSGHEPGHRRG